jgi:lipoprotein-anchoring transpeptidase ErfK/SrfK
MSSRTARRTAWTLALAILVAVALTTSGRQARAADIKGPTSKTSWSARVLAPTAVRVRPDHQSKAVAVLQPVAPLGGGPTILLVLERRVVADQEWVRLLLPRRPNGSSGWVVSDVLRFRENPVRIVIDQSERRTYVYRKGLLVLLVRNAVGTPQTPTPNGRFAVAEKVLTSPGGFLGPVVLVTTGFSETLNEYAGGNGRFAMHGTSLPQLIGTRASHGCIRHSNASILRISRLVAPGTPITIRA